MEYVIYGMGVAAAAYVHSSSDKLNRMGALSGALVVVVASLFWPVTVIIRLMRLGKK